jgi:hypothetical protein
MVSLTRLCVGVGLYVAYLLGIIFVVLPYSVPLYLVLLIGGVIALLVTMQKGWLTRPGNYNRLMQSGVDARATILEMKDTGITLNNDPFVKIRLRIEPPGGPAYEKQLRVAVSRIGIPAVGDTLNVRIDPNKPQDVIIP